MRVLLTLAVLGGCKGDDDGRDAGGGDADADADTDADADAEDTDEGGGPELVESVFVFDCYSLGVDVQGFPESGSATFNYRYDPERPPVSMHAYRAHAEDWLAWENLGYTDCGDAGNWTATPPPPGELRTDLELTSDGFVMDSGGCHAEYACYGFDGCAPPCTSAPRTVATVTLHVFIEDAR